LVVFGYEPTAKDQVIARTIERRFWKSPDPETLLIVLAEPSKLDKWFPAAELLGFVGQKQTPPLFSGHVVQALASWHRWVDEKETAASMMTGPIRFHEKRQAPAKEWQRAKAYIRLRAKLHDLEAAERKLTKLQDAVARDKRLAFQYAKTVGVKPEEIVTNLLLLRGAG
jgi:hypothetical protein